MVKSVDDVFHSENLVKKYNDKVVVNHVSIDVKQGEVVGLLGPNGAGKTTVFYMMVGMERPTFGEVFINDANITKKTLWQRANIGVGYLPQDKSVFLDLTVEDNILLPLEIRDYSRNTREERLRELLKEFDLENISKVLGSRISGGQRRRLELARLLAIEPSFILLDEPFAGVDPVAIAVIQDLIRSLSKKGIGVLITDHNVMETLSIVDRAYLLYNGEIICAGKPTDIANNKQVREVYLGRNFEIRKH